MGAGPKGVGSGSSPRKKKVLNAMLKMTYFYSGRNPDAFIRMIQDSSIFYIFHTSYNDRYNGFGESYICIYILAYEVCAS